MFDGGGGFTYTPYFDGPNDAEFGGIWFWHPCSVDDHRGPLPGPNGRTNQTWSYANADDPAGLTVSPSILCVTCGFHGFLIDGLWRHC